jgi:hypothetical protein
MAQIEEGVAEEQILLGTAEQGDGQYESKVNGEWGDGRWTVYRSQL